MPYYSLELILHTAGDASYSALKNYLVEWAQGLDITECNRNDCASGKDFRIRMRCQDPTVIFDCLAQLGRIKSAKIDET